MFSARNFKSNTYKLSKINTPSFFAKVSKIEMGLYIKTMKQIQKINLNHHKKIKSLNSVLFQMNHLTEDHKCFSTYFGKMHEQILTKNTRSMSKKDLKNILLSHEKYHKVFKNFCSNKKNLNGYYTSIIETKKIISQFSDEECIVHPKYKCYPDMIGKKNKNNSLIEIKVVRNLNFDSLKTQLLFYDFCHGGIFSNLILIDSYNGQIFKLKYNQDKDILFKNFGKMIGKKYLK